MVGLHGHNSEAPLGQGLQVGGRDEWEALLGDVSDT